MGRPKFDFVVEAVHYKPTGEVDWIRGYSRRGPTFSDYVILGRSEVIERLQAGQKFVAGSRVPQMASTFKVSSSLRLIDRDGKALLVSGESSTNRDLLEGVPIL